jgi:hypothetical protein
MDNDAATLEWLVEALEHSRSQGQTEVVEYLESIASDMVFEMEMAARRASLLSRLMQNKQLGLVHTLPHV